MLISMTLSAQSNSYEIYPIAFYNLENLFDTENDTMIWDEEFTPEGSKAWTEERYRIKLSNMAKVIDDLGKAESPSGVSILGVSEIENIKVLSDLIQTDNLANDDWGIVHYDSEDFRGIDVALLYKKKDFKVKNSEIKPVILYEGEKRVYTRDVLHVEGDLAGEEFHILVNHWPSRRGGEKKSSPKREAAAAVNKMIIDSIQALRPSAKFVVMGDLNDDPTNKSVCKVLKANGKKKKVKENGLFNPMWKLYKEGHGSNAYRDAWSLFDQIMVSENTLSKKQDGLFYYKVEIYKRPFMIQNSGHFKNYPFRTYAGGQFTGGYSDHFPVITYFLKKAN